MDDEDDADAGRNQGGYVLEDGSGTKGIFRLAIGVMREGCDVRLDNSIDVSGERGEVVF